ncbi:MAG: hypothetical protein V9G13_00930 [Marmoricola sp.]|nr:hypothetical protein [Nocardioidaceae bacterium]
MGYLHDNHAVIVSIRAAHPASVVLFDELTGLDVRSDLPPYKISSSTAEADNDTSTETPQQGLVQRPAFLCHALHLRAGNVCFSATAHKDEVGGWHLAGVNLEVPHQVEDVALHFVGPWSHGSTSPTFVTIGREVTRLRCEHLRGMLNHCLRLDARITTRVDPHEIDWGRLGERVSTRVQEGTRLTLKVNRHVSNDFCQQGVDRSQRAEPGLFDGPTLDCLRSLGRHLSKPVGLNGDFGMTRFRPTPERRIVPRACSIVPSQVSDQITLDARRFKRVDAL